jgi:hypothetical protein
MTTRPLSPLVLVLVVALASCAADTPPQYGDVVTMDSGMAAAQSGYPPPGTVWRLDEQELHALSPAPFVEPPPPPKLSPPRRPTDPPPAYYSAPHYAPYPYYGPYFGPSWGWGPSFHFWRRW